MNLFRPVFHVTFLFLLFFVFFFSNSALAQDSQGYFYRQSDSGSTPLTVYLEGELSSRCTVEAQWYEDETSWLESQRPYSGTFSDVYGNRTLYKCTIKDAPKTASWAVTWARELGTCPEGTADDGTGYCVPADPPSECYSPEYPSSINLKVPAGSVAPAYCYNSCRYTVSAVVSMVIGTSYYTKGQLDEGSQCTGEPNYSDGNKPQCITDGGNTICYEQHQENCGLVNGEYICQSQLQNCGTVNGQEICIEDMPQGEQCSILGDGSYVCDPQAQLPTDSNGNPVPHDGVAYDSATGEQHYYYDNDTINNNADNGGSSSGNPVSDGESDNPLDLTQEEVDGAKEGEDQGSIDQLLADTGLSDQEQAVDDVGSTTFPTLDETFLPDLPTAAHCQTVSGSVLGTWTFTIPTPEGCLRLAQLKEILAWMVWIITLLYCWNVTMTHVNPRSS